MSKNSNQVEDHGSSHKKPLLKLAFPVYFELLSSVISGIIDTVWVARLGKVAVAAVTTATFLENAMLGFILFISLGVTVLLSNRIGQKKYDEVKVIIKAGWVLSFFVIVLAAIPGFIFREKIAALLVSSKSYEIIGSLTSYLTVLFPGLLILFSQSMVDSILKGNKDTKTPMKSAIIANLIILVLDPILIFGLFGFPRMGVFGAALATLIGRAIALSWSVTMLFKSSLLKKVANTSSPMKLMTASGNILKIGVPLASDFCIRMLGGVFLIKIISQFGEIQLASYGICVKIVLFCTMAFYSIRQASSIITAGRIGEGYSKELKVIANNALYIGLIVMGGFIAVFIIGNKILISLFTDNVNVINASKTLLYYLAVYLVPLGLSVVISGSLIGSGNGRLLLISTVCGISIQLILAYYLSNFLGRATGIWLAMIIAAVIQAAILLSTFYFVTIKTVKEKMTI